MAYTLSNMIELGTKAPDFNLPNPATGTMVSLADFASKKATVIMFLCNHCPYVHYVNPQIVEIVEKYQPLGVSFVGINSNDIETHPEDSPENMVLTVAKEGYTFPYLFDETQEVAKRYDAACTPDFYVFDGAMRLVYRGQLDDSRPKRNPIPATGKDLRNALEAVLAGQQVSAVQRPSGGCNIKWRDA